MRILAIETSCDETAISIVERKSKSVRFMVLANIVSSQARLHAAFGGVVPNLARREHQKNLVPILIAALKEAKLCKQKNEATSEVLTERCAKTLAREQELKKIFPQILEISQPAIDAIAVTQGPGLEPALWVGINFAKALACLWNKPLIPINHMEGHIFSALITPKKEPATSSAEISPENLERQKNLELKKIKCPAIALLVSGGHTELVLIKGIVPVPRAQGQKPPVGGFSPAARPRGIKPFVASSLGRNVCTHTFRSSLAAIKKPKQYKIIGETLDDAAGEAFDKVAKMLGLGYPGGPVISKLANKGNPRAVIFPRPMLNSKNFDFSFSGLKTAVLYYLKDAVKPKAASCPAPKQTLRKASKLKADVAASFEAAAIEVLAAKTIRAMKNYKAQTLILGGGVAANISLRKSLKTELEKNLPNAKYFFPSAKLAGDNALMIAVAAFFGKIKPPEKIRADGLWRLS